MVSDQFFSSFFAVSLSPINLVRVHKKLQHFSGGVGVKDSPPELKQCKLLKTEYFLSTVSPNQMCLKMVWSSCPWSGHKILNLKKMFTGSLSFLIRL
jgi:hypothetical protein